MKRVQVAEIRQVVSGIDAVRSAMPADGMTLAAFEALALRGVAPDAVWPAVRSLHNRREIYVRRNRGEVRIFPQRPAKIAGVFGEPAPVDRLLSSAAPHARRLAGALAALRAAKACGDQVGANAARDALDAFAGRVVGLIVSHVERGLSLADARDAMWATFSADVMEHLATFEPALARASASTGLAPVPSRKRRIPSGLPVREKVVALIVKAGVEGALKTDLLRGIRPKVEATELQRILDSLISDRLIDARDVRVRGRRFAARYFAAN